MNKIISFFLSILYKIWQMLKKNPKIAALQYGGHNKKIFSNVAQHERMLACDVRVDTYFDAIQKYISEGDTVVDLGTGTGVLSFFASQKKPKRIFAIDHGNIIELAKYLGEKNGVKNITYINEHSSNFNPPEKVDVILHEQIGDFLIDEDMVKNICELRDRILKPGGKILPDEFDLYFEPVSLKDGQRTPFIWEQNLHGIQFKDAKKWLLDEKLNKIGKTKLYHGLYPGQVSHYLCQPKPIYSFQLSTAQPDEFPRKFTASKMVTKDGVLDGFCLFFNIRFDDELVISTDPLKKPTVWHYQMFRTERMECRKGDTINVELETPNQTKTSTWKVKHAITKGTLKAEVEA